MNNLRCGFTIALVLAATCGSRKAHAQNVLPGKLSPAEIKVLEKLAKKNYFKDATCAQFANLILKENKLPEIGATEPSPPLRGNIDRRNEDARLPELKDGATLKTNPLFEVKIATASDGADSWSLTLHRSLDIPKSEDPKLAASSHLDAETAYLFKVGAINNKPLCDLIKISYKAKPRGAAGNTSIDQSYNTVQCLDLFLTDFSSLENQPLGSRELFFIKKDCAIGMHFFAEAKAVLARRKLGLNH
ncbi:MAG: hypothetical protein P4M08_00600 [Oligoflexia bacterium]|nr:hypothetical protein [Oligoflexia bacterium]